MIDHHPLHFVILGTTSCPWCDKVAELIDSRGHTSFKLLFDRTMKQGNPIHTFLHESDLKTVPQVFINGWLLGGYEATESYLNSVSPSQTVRHGVHLSGDQLRNRNGLGTEHDPETYQFNF